MASKKTYTKEFKEEAVRLAQQNGNTSEKACSPVLPITKPLSADEHKEDSSSPALSIIDPFLKRFPAEN